MIGLYILIIIGFAGLAWLIIDRTVKPGKNQVKGVLPHPDKHVVCLKCFATVARYDHNNICANCQGK